VNQRQNIVLTGFMGTGKSTVGRIIADRLGWRFVDADEEIVTRIGMSISEIFERQGEAAFRRYESMVCQSLVARSRQVIATGGGMLVDPANLRVMESTGFVVCLDAHPDVIRTRLGGGEGRPLAGNWEELLHNRREAYGRIPRHVDTSHKSPKEAAQEVYDLWLNASV